MSKGKYHGPESTNRLCKLLSPLSEVCLLLPKVSSARAQLCNPGSDCWGTARVWEQSGRQLTSDPTLSQEPHLSGSVLGQTTLSICVCPALCLANPNINLLMWLPASPWTCVFTMVSFGDEAVAEPSHCHQTWCAFLVQMPWDCAHQWAHSSACSRLLPCGASSLFCSLELGFSFICRLSIYPGSCKPSSRSLSRCLSIGFPGNLTVLGNMLLQVSQKLSWRLPCQWKPLEDSG